MGGLSRWDSTGNKCLGVLYVSKSEKMETIEYTATDDIEFLRICNYKSSAESTVVEILESLGEKKCIVENAANIAKVSDKVSEYRLDKYWAYSMQNVLCIGDSLTSGASYAEQWGEMAEKGSSIDQNYPRILGRMLNANVINAGFSGYSASTWYSDYDKGIINNNQPYDFSKFDTFIIWLGTNNGLTDTLDEDVNLHDDYHAFADTETGCYCKIIESIKAANTSCLIVLTKIFASKGDYIMTNKVIEKIAYKYNLPIIDNSDLDVDNHPELHAGVNNPHFGKAGNIFIANRCVKELGKWFEENPLRCEYGYTPRTN